MFDEIYLKSGIETRQINAENPTGEKGGGCKAVPCDELRFSKAAEFLGEGWKVNPFISLDPGQETVLADIEGSGCINSMWITSNLPCFNDLVLRIYWDKEDKPSVEVPLGSFFCMGHDFAPHTVDSAMVIVAPHRALNCYWQMPFRKHAKFVLSNEGETEAKVIAFKIMYTLKNIPQEAAYFHAQFRYSVTTTENPEHTLIDNVKGKGVYVGTYIACDVLVSGWWGEGEVKFYIDGDDKYPTIADNGTEDYFGGAWNFGGDHAFFDHQYTKSEQEFNTMYLGVPLSKSPNPQGPRKYSMYRWHMLDPIGFKEDLKVTIQTLGWYPNRYRYRPIPIAIGSVSYWYQSEPHVEFPKLLDVVDRCEM